MNKSRIKFLNTQVDNVTMQEAVELIKGMVEARIPSYVVTPNMDHIVVLEKDKEFAEIYKNADLILTDGMPLVWISRLLGKPIKEKISGSDIFPEICKMASLNGYKIYILGAAKGVANKAAENLQKRYDGLKIVGTYSPPIGFENDFEELNKIRGLISDSKPDILAVSLGSPKGEKFIYRHLNEFKVPVNLSIGATIDFEAGNVKRAPNWMSNHGLEWLFRIFQDPKRLIKRYGNDLLSIIPIILKYK